MPVSRSRRCSIRTNGTRPALSAIARTWSGACSSFSSERCDDPGAGLRLRWLDRRYRGADLPRLATDLSRARPGATSRAMADHYRNVDRTVRSAARSPRTNRRIARPGRARWPGAPLLQRGHGDAAATPWRRTLPRRSPPARAEDGDRLQFEVELGDGSPRTLWHRRAL